MFYIIQISVFIIHISVFSLPDLKRQSLTQDVVADLGGDAEPLLIREMVQQEGVDPHPLLLVLLPLQREELLLPVAEHDILQRPKSHYASSQE